MNGKSHILSIKLSLMLSSFILSFSIFIHTTFTFSLCCDMGIKFPVSQGRDSRESLVNKGLESIQRWPQFLAHFWAFFFFFWRTSKISCIGWRLLPRWASEHRPTAWKGSVLGPTIHLWEKRTCGKKQSSQKEVGSTAVCLKSSCRHQHHFTASMDSKKQNRLRLFISLPFTPRTNCCILLPAVPHLTPDLWDGLKGNSCSDDKVGRGVSIQPWASGNQIQGVNLTARFVSFFMGIILPV